MSILKKLFTNRDAAIKNASEKILAIRLHQTIMSKRLSYLESRHPEIFAKLMDKESPIARIRKAERDRIALEVDKLLEELK